MSWSTEARKDMAGSVWRRMSGLVTLEQQVWSRVVRNKAGKM